MEPNVLLLYDVIDADEAQRVGRQLTAWYPPDAPELRPLHVRVHSPGGEVFSGFAIYHQLVNLRHRGVRVETVVDGLAASMAGVVVMAGEPASIATNAQIMIHNPWARTQGDSDTLRQTADELDRLRRQLLEVYATKSGRPPEAFVAAMDAETYYSATEAVALGLADRIVPATLEALQGALTGSAAERARAYRQRGADAARLEALERQLTQLQGRLVSLEAQGRAQPEPRAPLTERLYPADAHNPRIAPDRRDWTIRTWERRDPAGLARLRAEAPEVYRRLFDATYRPTA